MNDQAPRIVILGASARGAAQSAIRGGLTVCAADMFGDVDLRRCGQVLHVDDYPCGLVTAAATLPSGPWMYTGALENHPALVERISKARMLAGNSARCLRRVRSPEQLFESLAAADIHCPHWQPTAIGLPRDGTWLCKPHCSAGGLGIMPWGARSKYEEVQPGRYFQERIEGQACGAVFVAAAGKAVLVGVTKQWSGDGTDSGGPVPFKYGGSWGPLPLDAVLRWQFVKIGDTLAREFGLVGLFGVDVILANQMVWPLEVNPRYTASVEVLERALGIQAIPLHLNACLHGTLPGADELLATPRRWSGKAIVYAPRDLVISPEFAQHVDGENSAAGEPAIADIPAVGTRIGASQPVVTVLVDADDEPSLLEKLLALKTRVTSWLETCF